MSVQVVAYRGAETMEGMDQDGLRFEGNCTLQLPKSSTHCTDCFSTIAAFQNKVTTASCSAEHPPQSALAVNPFSRPACLGNQLCTRNPGVHNVGSLTKSY